ncbi:MAG: hypothetical protein Q8Q09_21295 [Deltaproteobacteria bacterium]|nr:hypothetical protein [Deltaproteobacteria bacterium]
MGRARGARHRVHPATSPVLRQSGTIDALTTRSGCIVHAMGCSDRIHRAAFVVLAFGILSSAELHDAQAVGLSMRPPLSLSDPARCVVDADVTAFEDRYVVVFAHTECNAVTPTEVQVVVIDPLASSVLQTIALQTLPSRASALVRISATSDFVEALVVSNQSTGATMSLHRVNPLSGTVVPRQLFAAPWTVGDAALDCEPSRSGSLGCITAVSRSLLATTAYNPVVFDERSAPAVMTTIAYSPSEASPQSVAVLDGRARMDSALVFASNVPVSTRAFAPWIDWRVPRSADPTSLFRTSSPRRVSGVAIAQHPTLSEVTVVSASQRMLDLVFGDPSTALNTRSGFGRDGTASDWTSITDAAYIGSRVVVTGTTSEGAVVAIPFPSIVYHAPTGMRRARLAGARHCGYRGRGLLVGFGAFPTATLTARVLACNSDDDCPTINGRSGTCNTSSTGGFCSYEAGVDPSCPLSSQDASVDVAMDATPEAGADAEAAGDATLPSDVAGLDVIAPPGDVAAPPTTAPDWRFRGGAFACRVPTAPTRSQGTMAPWVALAALATVCTRRRRRF